MMIRVFEANYEQMMVYKELPKTEKEPGEYEENFPEEVNLYIAEGEAILKTQIEKIKVHAGDILVIPAGTTGKLVVSKKIVIQQGQK